jgi:hypothetical protein
VKNFLHSFDNLTIKPEDFGGCPREESVIIVSVVQHGIRKFGIEINKLI